MTFKVLTVYGKKDGYCNGLYLARKEDQFKNEFISHIQLSNKEAEKSGRPLLKIDDYEIRCLGELDDEETKLTPCKNGYTIVPMIVNEN